MKYKIIAVLKLVRWFHELVAVLPFLSLYLVIDHFINQKGIICSLSLVEFITVCFAVQLLIAAGCVLNDIADREIDKVNKPSTHIIGSTISLKEAQLIFIILSVLILLTSIYISSYIFNEWTWISLSVYALSFLYDFKLKRSPLLGNILMAVLTAFIPLVILFFARDCLSILGMEKLYVLIFIYAILPFLIIIPRELSLDISDIKGDELDGCKTLPILIGIEKSRLILKLLILLIIFLSIPFILLYPYHLWPCLITDFQLLIYLYLFQFAKNRIDYIKIGRYLWFIMIFGLILFTVFTLI